MKKRLVLLLLAAMLCLAGCEAAPEETTVPTEAAVETAPKETVPAEPLPAIAITEVMPDNEKLWLGHDRDWVELYNSEEEAWSLEGWYLTDDPQLGKIMDLSEFVIPAEGYLAVTLDESFGLSSAGETVYLTCGTEIVSSLSYPAVQGGASFDQNGPCQWTTPGYANTENGYYAYLESCTLPELIISEVLPSNSRYMGLDLEYYDLVEVMNNSRQAIDLSSYGLTDKAGDPARYSFPNVVLQPGEHYVVYCSDNASLGENHAPFKVSAQGETLFLSKDGTLIDVLTVPGDLQEDESFGRVGNLPMYLEHPTFGEANAAGYRSGVAVPTADIPSGLYEEAVSVTLSGEGTIYYTTDGSRPTEDSRQYTAPITVSDVTTIRTFCVSGSRKSEIANYTYVVGKTHDLPIVTVAIAESALTGGKGILTNIFADFEYEAVMTLFEDGEEKFNIPLGFLLHGNDSRRGAKKNFSLRFRSEYGAGKLHYKLFEDRDIDTFDSLLLKGGSEDWNKAIMRDELATQIANGTTHLYTQAMKPVVLYLGGQYWGIYYLRERFSDQYVASHMGVSPESVDLLRNTSAHIQSGDREEYRDLRDFVASHDMEEEENYRYLAERIDVLSLMDWYICRSYMGDKDTGNIRRFRSREADGLWHWMYFDLDWSFVHTTDRPLTSISNSQFGDPILFRGLVASQTGKDLFLKRYAQLMGTILNEEYFNQVIDEIVGAIESEVPRDRERWDRTVSHWEKSVQALRDYVKDGVRTKNVLEDLEEFFDLSDEEMEYYFGDVMP